MLYQIPSKAKPFDGFQTIFVNACEHHAEEWNLPADVLAEMKARKTDWDAAYLVTANLKTKSPVATAARNALLGSYRDLLNEVMHRYIVGNDAVSEADKRALGLHPRKTARKTTPAPNTVPVLNLDTGLVSAHRVLYHDSATPETQAKPVTAKFCELWYRIGGEVPASPSDTTQRCCISRSGQEVAFDVADKGKTVYYYGRWVNGKGQHGPWSQLVSAPIV